MSEDFERRLRDLEMWRAGTLEKVARYDEMHRRQDSWNEKTSSSLSAVRVSLGKVSVMVAGTSASTAAIMKLIGAI